MNDKFFLDAFQMKSKVKKCSIKTISKKSSDTVVLPKIKNNSETVRDRVKT